MEKIILNAMFNECRDEGSLWAILCEITMLFPEQLEYKNLAIAKEATIWMYKTQMVTFYRGGSEQKENLCIDEIFLS